MTTANLTLEGTLVASADADSRVLEYLLLPFGEPGRTSAGTVTASAGVLELPEVLVGNYEHDRKRPIAPGRVDEREDGLYARFEVPETTAGNDLLAEARIGLRPGVSVELEDFAVRGGRLVAGRLVEAGFVRTPAFPSALLVAEDYGELVERDESVTVTHNDGSVSTTETHTETSYSHTDPDASDEDDDENQETETVTASLATAPAGGVAARTASGARKRPVGRGELFELLANAHRKGGKSALTAALADIVPADVVGMEQPQFVDELWSGRGYQRRIIPLFNHADLTSFTVRGWRWVTKPVVAPYTGNKTAVPSNTVQTEQLDIPAERIAGAHDIDRKHKDFNDAAFFAAYYAAMTESYAEVSDAQVLADVLAGATAVTPGTVPTDVPEGLVYVVDGALSVLDATRTVPGFALVATNLWRDILLTPRDKTLEYLSAALGLEDGSTAGFKLLPAPELAADQVLVGARAAVTVHELGGPAPIRVEAENIANGGVDAGVFGYYATNIHDEGGLALVTPTIP